MADPCVKKVMRIVRRAALGGAFGGLGKHRPASGNDGLRVNPILGALDIHLKEIP
jgi:hypothetical protein